KDTVAQCEAEQQTFVGALHTSCCRSDCNTLQADHFADYAAAGVRGSHEDLIQTQLDRCDVLQGPEEGVSGSIAACQEHAQPAQQRTEEREQHAGACDHQCKCCCGSGVIHQISESDNA